VGKILTLWERGYATYALLKLGYSWQNSLCDEDFESPLTNEDFESQKWPIIFKAAHRAVFPTFRKKNGVMPKKLRGTTQGAKNAKTS
jgi:hypothetical protein